MTYLQLAKEFWTSGNNILLSDHNNRLWLAGCNSARKSGINTYETILGHPHDLKHSLYHGETVVIFKSYIRNLFILTNYKRLIVFRIELKVSYDIYIADYINAYTLADNYSVDNSQQLDLLAQLDTSFQQHSPASNLIPNLKLSEPSHNEIIPDSFNQEHLFECINKTEAVTPSHTLSSHTSSPITSWRLLNWDKFTRLQGKARSDYIAQTRSMISDGIGISTSWTQSEENLSLAIRQIEEPESDLKTLVPEANHHHIQSLKWHPTKPSEPMTSYRNVDGIVFGPYGVVFKIGNRFVIEILTIDGRRSIPSKFRDLPLTRINMTPNSYTICEACMLAYDECRFLEHYIYLRNANSNFIIFPIPSYSTYSIKFIKFPDPFPNFNPEILHWRRSDDLIYFIHNEVLWYHDNNTDSFVRTATKRDELIITRTHFTDEIYVVTHVNCEYRMISNYGSKQIILDLHNEYPLQQIQIYNLRCCQRFCAGLCIITVNSALNQHIWLPDLTNINLILLHTNDFKYYGVINDKMFAYIDKNIMHTITCKCGVLDTMAKAKYDIRPLPVPDSDITTLHLQENVIIESHVRDYKYIYYGFYCNCFNFYQQLVSVNPIVQISDADIPINEHLLFRQMITNEFMSRNVTDLTNCFWELIDLVSLIKKTTLLSIDIRRNSWGIATGRGVRFTFFTKAAQGFADLYLVSHNHVTEFHNRIQDLTDEQLEKLGKALTLMLFNLQSHLPVRLPLILVYMIKCRPPLESDLEFIAGFEDPEAVAMLREIRNDPAALETAGFKDYCSGLQSICKFDLKYEKSVRAIARGFLTMFHSQNITLMNFLTIDQYLSGKYSYDIKHFQCQIKMITVPDKLQILILNEIDALSRNEFATLLLNWSGKSSVDKTAFYSIAVIKNLGITIKFSTCSRTIYIDSKIMDETSYPEFAATLKIFLTDKCDIMQG